MLMTCPECGLNVSDKAIACPHCGYPINLSRPAAVQAKPRQKKKYKKLPNGYGSIKKLSGNRRRPYAAFPPCPGFKDNGSPISVRAIGYFETWHLAYQALQEYLRDPHDPSAPALTFSEMYELFYKDKFEKSVKEFSEAAKKSYRVAFANCKALQDKPFKDLRKKDLQGVLDNCTLKHASLELIQNLFRQMYKFAMQNDLVDKDYSQYVTINVPDDDEKGEPFSEEQLRALWEHADQKTVQIILIMIYSGFRISAFETIEINLQEQYFKGGVKTKAGKGRIVPIHPAISSFVQSLPKNFKSNSFRKQFGRCLRELSISSVNGKKHSPHDCRHTFSWLCDKYHVDDLSKHLLMGHSLGNDVEKSVYGHRTLEELRTEICKIQAPA